MFRLWLGVTVSALRRMYAQYCPFQSHTSHLHLYRSPVLYFGFQHAAKPLLRGVQTREASVCSVNPDTRQCRVALPVSAHCVYMYIPVY